MALTLVLASCGKTTEAPTTNATVKKTPTPIQIESGSLGKTNASFTEDLNKVVEGAYENAASGSAAAK